MQGNVLFENENYRVTDGGGPLVIEDNTFSKSYAITNTKTDVIEFRTPCLPEALGIAVKWDLSLNKEHHLWPLRQASSNEVMDVSDLLQ